MSLQRDALRLLIVSVLFGSLISFCQAEDKRSFTVADDIQLSYFGDPFQEKAEPIVYSPDGEYAVVHTERGRLDLNRCESSLKIYRMEDVGKFLARREETAPEPIWAFAEATYKDGPIITRLRWLRDSSGFGFLAKSESGEDRLFLADLGTKTIRALTPEGQSVTGFDIRDSSHYVYTALSPSIREQIEAESKAVSVVGTNRRIFSLLSPAAAIRWHDLSELWGVIGEKRVRIEDPSRPKPLAVYWRGELALALSPDGHTVLTALPLPAVPSSWESLYPPPFPSDAHHIRSGPQDLDSMDGWFDVSRYALVDLNTGAVQVLPLGPLGYEADWIGLPFTDWSSDGTRVALTDSFFDREASPQMEARPCAVVVDIHTKRVSCVEPVYGQKEDGEVQQGYRLVNGIRFDRSNKDRLILDQQFPRDVRGRTVYTLAPTGQWIAGSAEDDSRIQLSIKQSMNDPPVLVASDNAAKVSRLLWDPNPWLKDVELGEVSVYQWKDVRGRELIGGLYEPPHAVPGKRYPLVIQTHGFSPNDFVPSGVYPTGLAARELAAAGFVVLQVRGCPVRGTPEEGPCQVAAYEGAVRQLTAEGRIDPDRIGIVGFSRTCYYALEALTTSSIHFRAASITDGVNMGYLEYLVEDKTQTTGSVKVVGSAPFGDGIEKWIERSPEFNLHKVRAPLLVVGVGEGGMLADFEPYAALWHMDKPVDLLILKEGTHPLTNPAQRMVSQGSTVDWMRFWLKGEEDPDPAKREQYNRWRGLRNLDHTDADGQK
jgi:dipeptidyl aminopeptidase/acylaminoacyl peptidase